MVQLLSYTPALCYCNSICFPLSQPAHISNFLAIFFHIRIRSQHCPKYLILSTYWIFASSIWISMELSPIGSSPRIPSGSPHTNFWLLYTFKVLNILFWENFRFNLLIWCSDIFFWILGRARKFRRVDRILNIGSFTLLRY
jgi:hypothetical protein